MRSGMLNGNYYGTQKVYNYNIEMMLYAFKYNQLQNYNNKALFGVASEVYYRNGGNLHT